MDLSIKKLIELNFRGVIPGPKESVDDFKKRVAVINNYKIHSFFKKKELLTWHDFDWSRSTTVQLFDVSPDWVQAYYSNKGLNFWQGAMTCVTDDELPLLFLQIRKNLKKGKYLFIYDKDEILSHELAHAARMAFNEPKTEEIFAYWTSTSHLRKLFGPIFRNPFEANIFMFSLIGGIFFQMLLPFYSLYFLIQTIHLFSFGMLSFCLFRLFITRTKVNKTLKKLAKIFNSKSKGRAVLFRLTDKEICLFAKISTDEILNYVTKLKEKELRWKVIYFSYFQK